MKQTFDAIVLAESKEMSAGPILAMLIEIHSRIIETRDKFVILKDLNE